MKRGILCFSILMLLSSCYFPRIDGAIFPEFDTVVEAQNWIRENTDYACDDDIHGIPDEWQTPAETVALGTGDCEDFAILFMQILHDQWNAEPEMVVIEVSDIYHAIVKYDGTYYEPRNANYHYGDEIEIVSIYPFDLTFSMMKHRGI